MAREHERFETSLPQGEWFATTQWSIVVQAGEGSSTAATSALEKLCKDYWRPLYCYARKRGQSPHDAEDLTQEFFSVLVADNYLHRAEREKGRFRSYILTAFRNFLSDQFDRSKAAKRGGKASFVSLNAEEAEGLLEQEASLQMSPEQTFENQWILAILERALNRLRGEYEESGRTGLFVQIKPFLTENAPSGGYTNLAAALSVSPNSVAVAVHRMRQRYREIVRLEIAATVTSVDELEEEMKALLSAAQR
jgi:RNA polymerase sigma-70 factor (ECF subfamily)